jgi:diguanylate cyclase (GGDEF)-like protein/PAS domain S-box-containing protein
MATRRNSARRQVEQAHVNLAAIVECSQDAIISRDLNHRIQSWNAGAERLFGYAASEMIGQDITALIVPPECQEEAARNREVLAQGNAVLDFETTSMVKGGRRIDVSLSLSPIRNERGIVVGAALIVRDISGRKRAERELQHKARLSNLLEALARATNEAATPEAALQSCLRRICDYGNWTLGRVAVFALGQPPGTLQRSIWHCHDTEPFTDFIRQSDRFDLDPHAAHFIGVALHEQRPVWIEDIAAASTGERLLAAVKAGLRTAFAFPVIVNGKVAAFLEFCALEARPPDIDFMAAIATIGSQLARAIERKHALDETRANEHKLDSILGALHEVVWSMDPRSGRILYLNAAAGRLARRAVDDFLTDRWLWRRMVHREDRAPLRDSLRKLLRGGRLTHEFRIVLGNGTVRVMENRAHVVRNAKGRLQRIDGTMTDITERKHSQERIEYLAQYDIVTGLPNRRLFNDRLTLAIARDKRLDAMTAVLLLDLDRFKQVNEMFGHSAGDKVLQVVTTRLRERLREVDTIARLGGDEFVVILESVTDTVHATRVAKEIVAAVAEPLMLDGQEIFVTASIGVALCPADADSVEKLIERAELAMYQAKQEGRNTVQLYAPEQYPRRGTSLGTESKLRRALERDELQLDFQPKVNIATGAVTGAEALVRWRNPELGLVPPADFIPLAEETGLIVPIGEWVLHHACAQASAWCAQGHPIAVAVNLSARQFRQNNLVEIIKHTLADTGLAADYLELEITESMIMHRPEQTIATLQQLDDIGVVLSVDDFGTGYSSLSYLKRFPVHKLKVDQSFVRELHQNADDAAIVRAVIALAGSLNLKTIAEGVETEQQLSYLAGLGCDEYQGYHFSKPLPAAELLSLLAVFQPAATTQTKAAEFGRFNFTNRRAICAN